MLSRACALATAGAVALSCPDAGLAETGGDPEIVVTAQLREQRASAIPMAVTVLRGEELDRFGLAELEDAARFMPGLLVQNQSPNNPGFVVRGITSDSGAAFAEPRVSVFADGISISKSRGSYVELFDLDRIEASKGPQTTLYGRGALIGAINIIQNKPDPDRVAAHIDGSRGNRDAWTAEAMINLPVAEGVALRLAGRARRADGYVDNLLGGEDFNSDDMRALRASLRLRAAAVTIDLIANVQRDRPSGTSFKSIAYRPTDPLTGAVIGDGGRNSGAALAAGPGFEGGRPLGLDRKLWSLTGLATAELSDRFDLVSLSGYRRFEALELFDVDGMSLPLLTAAEDARGEQFSQEIRLRYSGGPLTAFLGASYFHEQGSQRTPAQFDERMTLAQLTGTLNGGGLLPGRPASDPAPLFLFANPAFIGALVGAVAQAGGHALSPAQAGAIAANLRSDHRETSINFARTTGFDIFTDASLALSDRFELGAGLRWSHDDKRTRYGAAVLNGRSVLGGLLGALSLPEPQRGNLLAALAQPGAATLAPSAAYPVPLFGLGLQPTAGNGGIDAARLKDSGLSWRLTARYTPGAAMTLYANYARGRRPRVLSASAPISPDGAAVFGRLPNERVDSFEIGAKSALASRRLFIDAAVYHYRYANFQTIVQQGTQFLTVNAGRARSTGLEGQMRYQFSRTVGAFAGYGYNRSRFASGLLRGNSFRLAPDHMASLGLEVDSPAGPGRLSFTPSVTWQSTIYFDDDNDRPDLQQIANGALVADSRRDERQRGYALVNLRLGYRLDNGVTVEGFVDNFLDRRFIKDAGNSGDDLGLPTFIAGERRAFGVRTTLALGRPG